MQKDRHEVTSFFIAILQTHFKLRPLLKHVEKHQNFLYENHIELEYVNKFFITLEAQQSLCYVCDRYKFIYSTP
jgi:hypothetical protein